MGIFSRLAASEISSFQLFQVFRQAGVLLGAILLTQTGLGRDFIGTFELFLFLGATLSFFWVNGFMQGFLRFAADLQSRTEQRSFFLVVYLFLFFLSGLLFVLLKFWGPSVALGLGVTIPISILSVYVVWLLLHLPGFLVEHYFLLDKDASSLRRYGWYQMLGYLAALGIPSILNYGIREIFIGLILWSAGKHLFLAYKFFGEGMPKPDFTQLMPWIRLSLPLIAYAFIGGFHDPFDSWLVNQTYSGDPGIFALYRYGSRELPFILVLSAGLSTAMIPEVSREGPAAYETLKSRATFLMHLLFPLSILLLATSVYWFPLIFSSDFAAAVPVFNTLVLILISRTMFPQTLMIALGQQSTLFWVSVAELAINILLSIWLVRIWGLQGIIAGTLLAYFFEKITYMFILYVKFGLLPKAYHNWKVWISYSMILLLVYFCCG